MKERQILAALQGGITPAIAASIKPTMKWRPVGRTAEMPADDIWLEIVHIPNNILNECWGSERTYRGIFRLLFHAPLKDEGAYPALDVVSSVSSYFTKDRVFSSDGVSVRIYEEPDLSGVIEAAPEVIYPVSCRYMSFQP